MTDDNGNSAKVVSLVIPAKAEYIALGLYEDARDTLRDLLKKHPGQGEILAKIEDLESDPHVSLAYFNTKSWEWVSVSGRARIQQNRAMIRDLFGPEDAQRLMSLVTLFFGLAPAIAPVIGGWLFVGFGWRSIFWFLALVGVGGGVLLVARGPGPSSAAAYACGWTRSPPGAPLAT